MAVRRGVLLVLSLIGLAVVISMASVVLMFFAASRGPSVPSSATLILRPGGNLPEVEPDDVVGQVFGRDVNTVRGFVEALRKASRDSRVRGVLLRPSTLELPYWGKVQEMRDAITAFRKSGKKVTAFLEYGGDREYYLASAADRVFLMPTSSLDLTGVASYEMFLRGTFDKIGAYPDFVHIGDYKTAPNQYTQKGFTPAHREMAQSLNRDMYEQLVAGVAEGRKKSEDEVRTLFDRGPFIAAKALEAGLVDELAYEDELDDRVPELGGDSDRRIEGSDYQRISFESAGVRPRSRIAVLYIVGTIASGKGGFDPVNGSIAGSEVDRRTDSKDSRRRLDQGDRAAHRQPGRIVGGVGCDLARADDHASGQSEPTDRDVDVGSRGIRRLLHRDPCRCDRCAAGNAHRIDRHLWRKDRDRRHARQGGRRHRDGDVGRQRRHVLAVHAVHGAAAREGRGVHAGLLQGLRRQGRRVAQDDARSDPRRGAGACLDRPSGACSTGWSTRLADSIRPSSLAKERAKIPADEDVQLVVYPERRNFFDALSEQFGGTGSAGMWSMLAGTSERRAVAALSAPTRLFRRGEPLALMPFTFVR